MKNSPRRSPQKSLITGLVIAVFSAVPSMHSLAATPAVVAKSGSALATPDQIAVERTASRLLARPELKQAHAEARALFLADSFAQTPSGSKTLEEAVDQLVLATVYDAIIDDKSRARIFWGETPAHRWFGQRIGDSRYGVDNPDNVYRTVVIDPAGHYELRGRHARNAPTQFSFQLYVDPSEKNRALLDTPLGGLLDKDVQVAADGSYTITLGPEAANGRSNHIQTRPEVHSLLVRNTLGDWSKQRPDWLEIRRLDTPVSVVADDDAALAARAVARLKEAVPFWLKFNHVHDAGAARVPNTLATPFLRGGNWGFAAGGSFSLAADEALLVTIDPLGARYTGFQLTDPWGASRDYIRHSGSLNNQQARANADGSYTYVIAASDPGVANWLDTGGLDSGGFAVRWQSFPQQPTSAEGAVREVRLVKLAELDRLLPPDTPRLSPAARARELAVRAHDFAVRLGR